MADHFGDVTKMVAIGSSVQRDLPDVRLSLYICCLIRQNANSSKPMTADGQIFSAMQTDCF